LCTCYTKIKVMRAGGVAQVVEWLPSKHESLSSNINTKKPQTNYKKKKSLSNEIGTVIKNLTI
jgi:hypothetical protein